jgi:FtsP/CotA-like multicopper oxidase with cupredoxin domain|tara:strand:+ start:150 stop:575 length:426 start_codon:yes stop_codon:yes gene_type:complete
MDMTNKLLLSLAKGSFSRRGGLRTMAAIVALTIHGGGLFPVSKSALAQLKKLHTVNLEVRKGKVTPARKTIRVTEGENVQIHWTTDEAAEIHLHGYDIDIKAEPGQTVSMKFEVHATGRFPITLHGFGHHTLIYLEVYPRP